MTTTTPAPAGHAHDRQHAGQCARRQRRPGHARRHDAHRLAGPWRPRPHPDAGPRRLRPHRPVLRVPRHARRRRRHRPRPGRVVGAQRDRRRVDVPAAPGRQVARRHRLHVGRRRRHHGPPRRRRELRPRRRHRGRRRRQLRPRRRRLHPRRAERQPAGTGLLLQRPDLHHAGQLRGRHHARCGEGRDGRLDPRHVRRRDGLHVRPQRRVVGRADPARQHRVHVLRRPRHDAHRHAGRRGRRSRAVLRHRRRRLDQRPQLQRPRDRIGDAPPDLDEVRQRPVRRPSACARPSP